MFVKCIKNMVEELDNTMQVYYVHKRTDHKEEVSFDKIVNRIKNLSSGLSINPTLLAQKIIQEIYDGIKTREIDELAAQLCASLGPEHPDYLSLASRIEISNLHKNTSPSFSETITLLYNNRDLHDKHCPLITKELFDIVQKGKSKLNSYIKYERDDLIDYFGLKTLQKSYLMKIGSKIIERPQQMIMRVALGIHGSDIKEALKTYDMMSEKYFIHATPTLFNAGTRRPQMSSCFLLSMKEDSIDGIYSTLRDCALISKWAGGIGLNIHNVRGSNSLIRGTNGISNGLIPMLRVFNNTARYVDQGGGKRKGSIAMYLEPWHSDMLSFLEMRKNTGNEEERARDLFYALWIPDLFMRRVQENGDWTLMCPDECPGLQDTHGADFDALYEKYEREGKGKKTLKASDIWYAIIESQIETGTPYMLYKDAANRKSNQKNLGTIKSSNLCTEIIEYSSPDEYAVCNLASIGLPRFIEDDPDQVKVNSCKVYSIEGCSYCERVSAFLDKKGISYEKIIVNEEDKKETLDTIGAKERTYPQVFINETLVGGCYDTIEHLRVRRVFNHDMLHKVSKMVTKNLDRIIDLNYYPVPETERSNKLHRPIGIGVQGLADVFAMLHLPFDSPEAAELNEAIFETIYHGAVEASIEIAKKREAKILKAREIADPAEREKEEAAIGLIEQERGLTEFPGAYSSFVGSPASEGLLQFDLWEESPKNKSKWSKIKKDLAKYGMRNSLLVAPMPTASTSQILGNNECFEPFTSNIYTRRTLAGEFIVINKHLIKDLIDLDMWNTDMKQNLIRENGSVQNIAKIPTHLKEIYKTVWEVGNKCIISMSAARGKYICQSQSLNLFLADPDFQKLTSMHFFSWRKGLKTGQYYLRTKAAAAAQKFTIEPEECLTCSA